MSKSVVLVKGTGHYKVKPTRVFSGGKLKLNSFAICIFLEGAALLSNKKLKKLHSNQVIRRFELLAKIAKAGINPKVVEEQESEEEGFVLEIQSDDLEGMIQWVKIRIDHCEKERGTEKFNPETMVDMKLLLLDLKTMLYDTSVE